MAGTKEVERPAVEPMPLVTKTQERAFLQQGGQKPTKAEILALRELCCPKDATPAEIVSFWIVSKQLGLNPFNRQIYLVRYGKGDEDEGQGRCVVQIGIDGFRAVSMDAGGYAGCDEPVFQGEGASDGINEVYEAVKVPHPMLAKVTVYRIVDGQRVAFIGIARWNEFAKFVKDKKTGKRRLNAMWSKMPYNQLAKCAEAQAHRKSAPARLSGIYSPEELSTVIDVVGTPAGPFAIPQRSSETGSAAASSGDAPKVKGGLRAQQLWNEIMDCAGGNSEEARKFLETLTAFDGQKGRVAGLRDWKQCTEKRAEYALRQLRDQPRR